MRTILILILLMVIVAFVSSLATWEVATNLRPKPPKAVSSPPVKPTLPEVPRAVKPTEKIKAKEVTLTVRSEGKKQWELEAKEVVLSQDEQTLIVKGLIKAVLYRKGKPYVTITADRAMANNITKKVVIEGNVRAMTADGLLIQTNQIEWDDKERKILCPGSILVSSKEVSVSTNRAALYVEKGLLICPSPVRAWTPEGGKLYAQKLKADFKHGILTLRGKVKAVIPVRSEV